MNPFLYNGGPEQNRTAVFPVQQQITTSLLQHCFSTFRNIRFDIYGKQTYKQPGLRIIFEEL